MTSTRDLVKMVKPKETESESEGRSHAVEPRFRISVCMKRFYSDERARAYVSVSARRRVRWLHRRLRRLFALPPAFRLLCRGHLLPPDEPLALLERDDPVEVVPVHVEAEDIATAQDVAESADKVATVEELQRPPSLLYADNLTESAPNSFNKVATVEELERSPSSVYPDDLTETKRQALLMLEQYCTQPAVEEVVRARRRRVRRRRRVPAAHLLSLQSADTDDEPAMFRETEAVAMVLRNDQQPRPPRVVRPLCDLMTATLLVAPPTEIFT